MRGVSTRFGNVLFLFIVDVEKFLSSSRGVWGNMVSVDNARTYTEPDLLAMLSFILVGPRS